MHGKNEIRKLENRMGSKFHECSFDECDKQGEIELTYGGWACCIEHSFECPECHNRVMIVNREPDGRCFGCNDAESAAKNIELKVPEKVTENSIELEIKYQYIYLCVKGHLYTGEGIVDAWNEMVYLIETGWRFHDDPYVKDQWLEAYNSLDEVDEEERKARIQKYLDEISKLVSRLLKPVKNAGKNK